MYVITFKSTFLEHFMGLGRKEQAQCCRAVEVLEENPDNTASKNIERLRNWERLWTIRVNEDVRLLYAIHGGQVVQLLDVGSHDHIYNHAAPKVDQYDNIKAESFDYRILESVMDPTSPTTAAQVPNYPASRRRTSPAAPGDKEIPMAITADVLERFKVPAQYHRALLDAVTESDLLEAVQGNSQLLDTLYDWLYNQPTLADIAQQPDYILRTPEDLERFADGDLLAFLLWLDPEQEPLVNFALQGPTLVKGGPGSGKSTVALYRVRELCNQLPGMVPTILFTTYTRALIKASEQLLTQLMGHLPDNVTVTTLDSIARHIVCEVEGRRHIDMADSAAWRDALATARTILRASEPKSPAAQLLNPYATQFPESYLIDEMQWVIEGQGLESVEDYARVERTGRSFPLNPEQRRAIWRIYELAVSHFEANGLLTWDALRRRALRYVKNGEYLDRYDYVLVDEAQDLTPVQIELCLHLCKTPAGLFLTADQSQSIYNKGFSWQRVHDDLRVRGRTRHLKRNYRTALEIAEAAHQFLHQSGTGDAETIKQSYVYRGSKPVVFPAASDDEQIDWLCKNLHAAARSLNKGLEAIAVLVPSKELGQSLVHAFKMYQTPAMFIESGDEFNWEAPAIKIMTMHAAKGLEFPIVALPYLEEGRLPRDLVLQDRDYAEKLDEQRRLFYVAATRAMRYLFVTFNRSRPSPFIADLSREHWHFVE